MSTEDWKIILRDPAAQQVVLYSEAEKKLQVRSEQFQLTTSTATKESTFIDICSNCGQPLPASKDHKKAPTSPPVNYPFIDRNYFRLLGISSRSTSGSGGRTTKSIAESEAATALDTEEDEDFLPAKNLSESAFNQGYYRRFFREDSKLGRGSGGSVFKCQHFLDDIQLGWYAVKKVPVGDDHSWLNRMLREVHILENLHHTNIIEYKHAWLEYHRLTPFGPSIPCLFILMQLAEGGNLEDAVLDSESICSVFLQILRGLDHLHRCGILHRDLKPSNILLQPSQDGQGPPRALITDFGEGVNLVGLRETSRTGFTGTIEFVAPELLKQHNGVFIGQHSKATDIWSLGMILYFMAAGRLPYDNIDDIDILRGTICSIRAVKLPEKVAKRLPKQFQDALKAMLQIDPQFRPTTTQLLLILEGRGQRRSSSSTSTSELSKQTKPKLKSLPSPPQPKVLDENTRITLAIFIILLSVIPTYPSLPPWNRSILAFVFTVTALKTSRPHSAAILVAVYLIFIASFLYNQ